MKTFKPIIKIPEDASTSSPIVERLGGRPWGLTDATWPRCSECDGLQSLLAQLAHHPDRLDLGGSGRMLFVFQCNHNPGICDTWDGQSGANACFVLEADQLVGTPADTPCDPSELDDRGVAIVSWQEEDDGLPARSTDDFFDESRFFGLPNEVVGKATMSARLGGVPHWIQSPDEAPRDGWRFAGQLDSTYSFHAPPVSKADWVIEDGERFEGRTHYALGPNFGDGGIGYIFLRSGSGVPEGRFFWQCG